MMVCSCISCFSELGSVGVEFHYDRRGMMMVQRRLLMREETIDKDERSICGEDCVSGMMDNRKLE
jgi:hypothetical protein